MSLVRLLLAAAFFAALAVAAHSGPARAGTLTIQFELDPTWATNAVFGAVPHSVITGATWSVRIENAYSAYSAPLPYGITLLTFNATGYTSTGPGGGFTRLVAPPARATTGSLLLFNGFASVYRQVGFCGMFCTGAGQTYPMYWGHFGIRLDRSAAPLWPLLEFSTGSGGAKIEVRGNEVGRTWEYIPEPGPALLLAAGAAVMWAGSRSQRRRERGPRAGA